jgi:hypothetical protein
MSTPNQNSAEEVGLWACTHAHLPQGAIQCERLFGEAQFCLVV